MGQWTGWLGPISRIIIFSCIFNLLLKLPLNAKGEQEEEPMSAEEEKGPTGGLFPPTFNLATEAIITANATCGQEGPETFCKLVEHVREPQCGVCDSSSSDETKRHPVTNAIDGSNNWWQSPSLQNGRRYEWITITLDLRQVYQVAYLIVKAANSPRPGNWVLERSLDGMEYKPWQYYVILDVECLDLYNIAPTIGIPRYISDDEVICTSFFSKLNPIENGEIHTSLVNGRPGAQGPSDKLQEFTSARYVRLRFQKMRTLNADLMTVSNRNWDLVDKSVTRRLFYSIKDISIGGQCMCFGHAQDCPQDPATNRLRCRCVHNTCGDSCEKCCPLYNQKKWRVGTSTDAGICEKCQCYGHATECRYDEGVAARRESINIKGLYEGGGVCINCKEFTSGSNCELCMEGFYRPIGVAKDDPKPCHKCLCDGAGATGRCVQEESDLSRLKPGDCICRDGFSGLACEKCSRGYRNYPICDPCPCNFAGTVNTDCEGECTCKSNVDGLRCDRCKPGFFNLDDENRAGCTKCYCFGITEKCDSAELGVEVLSPKNGWKVSDLSGQKVINPTLEGGLPTVANDDMIGHDTYYWVAPEQLIGNKLHSYGGRLHANVSWVTARGDSAGRPTKSPDIVLQGGGMIIAYGDKTYRGTDNVLLNITLLEQGWYRLTTESPGKADRVRVTRREFMNVLLSLDALLLRAKFLTDQLVVKLHSVAMEIGSPTTTSINVMRNVERCSCPMGYAGLSCEKCDKGYRRVNGTIHKGECRRCDCNGHADECDIFTGKCLVCSHNTTGESCDRCLDGFYGIATRGTPTDCRPCSCPLVDPKNNFSPSCESVIDSDGSVDYVCTACPPAYEGTKCERCADGFFGDPLVPGNFCRPCECSGNISPTLSGGCDRVTGECLKCTGNTHGWNCETCDDGYYGSGLLGSCYACDCNMHGSSSPVCNKEDGTCLCRPGYVGRMCDRCQENYGNIAAGCERCDCDPLGSTSSLCDPISGLCECKPGVFGAKCGSCLDGYFGFSHTGCAWCGCDARGSRNATCDLHTGQCLCWPSVQGRSCESCKKGFWNLTYSIGCVPCECDRVGSADRVCDSHTGVCECKPGVGGRTCSECLPKHFGFSNAGCKQCSVCNAPGHICHPHSGDCVCPPYTEGRICEKCRANTWGYHPYKGCQPCECSSDGSAGPQCDVTDGQCFCLEGYEGLRCDACHSGYFDFPKCKKCRCHVDGSLPSSCHPDGQCDCVADGQCRCRENTSGKKCRRCRPGTFGLTATNPKGCFECFCFGKSDLCMQAEYAWTRVNILEERQAFADREETSFNASNGLKVIPGTVGDITIGVRHLGDAPIYWTLPDIIKGDKVLSYNGRLSFTLEVDGGLRIPDDVLKNYPLVMLQGNFRLVLAHYANIPSPDGHYEVRLHEDLWKVKNNPETPVSRQMLMVALQNVRQIIVRVNDKADFDVARVKDVHLDVAEPATPFSPVVAFGVEICECPPQYVGTSCQDPATGYYRFRKKDFLNSKDILDLVGVAKPCPCNNRSNICDKETGICRHCRENTSGLFCEICSLGFYGQPNLAPCLPCACPTVDGSVSDSCEMDVLGGYVCTNCKKGYAGQYCEKCADGYYGDPLNSVKCLECLCDRRGSVVPTCHPITGQCVCLPGITGRRCTECAPRHALTDRGCQSCDDNCTGLLLDDLDLLKQAMAEVNLTGVRPAPWSQLRIVEQDVAKLKDQVDEYRADIEMGERLLVDFETTFNLEGRANLLYLKSVDVRRNAESALKNATITRERADEFLKETLALTSDIDTVVKGLVSLAFGLTNVSVNIGAALKEAEESLVEIRGRDFISTRAKAENELNKARALLELVRQLAFDPLMLEDLTKQLVDIKDKISDMMKHLQTIDSTLKEAKLLNEANRLKLAELQDVHGELNADVDLYEGSKSEAAEKLNDAKEWIDETVKSLGTLEDVAKRFINLTIRLDAFVNHMSRLNPHYEKTYVRPAERHALKLSREAANLNAVFNATRNLSDLALRAAGSYNDIATSLLAAHRAAKEAHQVATTALATTHPNGRPYFEQEAQRLHQLSGNLSSVANTFKDYKLAGLRKQLHDINETLGDVERRNEDVDEKLLELNGKMDNVPRDYLSELEGVVANTSRATEISRNVLDTVQKLQIGIDQELLPNLEKLKSATVAGLDNVSKSIERALRENGLVNDKVQELENRSRQFNKNRKELEFDAEALRNKIKQFKQAAWAIRTVSLSDVKGLCKRSLRVDLEPSVTTNIVIRYAISNNASNSNILFVSSSDKVDFMAVEMVNRRIRFVWNAGKDDKFVEHGLPIETNDDVLSNISRWYKIEINRIGYIGKLSVRSAINTSKSDPRPISAASHSNFARMDLDSRSNFYVGGYPENYTVSKTLSSGGNFAGCLYEVIFNEARVGLFDFKTSVGCTGCKMGVDDEGDHRSARFNGDGYAVVKARKPRKKGFYNVIFKFRTFDEDALLVLILNPETKDHLLLELQGGHVVFQLGIGGKNPERTKTKRTFNHGNEVSVEARYWDFTKGALTVSDGSHDVATLMLDDKAELNLRNCDMYIGGVPPNFKRDEWKSLLLLSLSGCMLDIQVEQTYVNAKQANQVYGVYPACTDIVLTTVAFSGDGYLELPAHSLKGTREGGFSFSFQTVQPNALLMLSVNDNENYYSAALKNGRVIVTVGYGKQNVTIGPNTTYNDGKIHNILLKRTNRELELFVDDVRQGAYRMKDVEFPSRKDGGLFFGGVNDTFVVGRRAASSVPLSGIIRDAVFNNVLLNFNATVGFKRATIGHGRNRTSPVTNGNRREAPDETEMTAKCVEVVQYTVERGAVKFGDAPHSFVQLPFTRNNFRKDFNLTFSLRTFYPNGLILIAAGAQKKRQYLMMYLSGGKVHVVIQGKKRFQLVGTDPVNDGQWQRVTLTKVKRKMEIAIGEAKGPSIKVPKQLTVSPPIYIGGLADDHSFPIIANDRTFKGCIRNFALNGRSVDLAGGKVSNVGQCFNEIVAGSFFAGDAYATYHSQFEVGAKMDIQLSFRTKKLNGILLSVSEPTNSPALALELHEGNVTLSADLGDRKVFRIRASFNTPSYVCDNEWHIVRASYSVHQLNLKVDNLPIQYGFATESTPRKIATKSALYIGGLPDSVAEGVLESRNNFVGCIRNVSINEKKTDWTDMSHRQNVQLDSCAK